MVCMLCFLAFALVRIWWFQGIVFQKGAWLIQSSDIAAAPNGTQFVTPGVIIVSIPNSFSRHDKSAMIRDFLAVLLLRFLPVLIVSRVGGLIAVLDIQHRWVQPFTNMYEKASLASDSLLLDYMTVSPLEVIPQAYTKDHYRVVYFGVISALKWVPPLTIIGIFAITETGSGVVVQISPTAASFAIIWLGLYIYSYFSFWPPSTRKLPRDVGSLFDLFCFFYDSELRRYPAFARAACSPDITKDELHSKLRLARHKLRFGLIGNSRKQHPGFDYADHVTWVKPVPGFVRRMKGKSRASPIDHGSDSNGEYDAHSMDDLSISSSMRRRRTSIREDAQWTGHSSAAN